MEPSQVRTANRIVQFMHPGNEPQFPEDGQRVWNRGVHTRCFLKTRGTILSDRTGSSRQEGVVCFWGEWEGPAHAERLEGNSSPSPTIVMEPQPTPCPRSGKLQNTDPFVFGDSFLYSCCKQVRKNGQRTYLTTLTRGDVILFGSHHDGKFLLDTVFVVAHSQRYNPRNSINTLGESVPHEFVEATLRPLEQTTHSNNTPSTRSDICGEEDWSDDDESCSVGLCPAPGDLPLTLYWGATFDNQVDGMFSFSPAKFVLNAPNGFARPKLPLDFIKPGMTSGFRDCLRSEHPETTVKEAWDMVVNSVLSQNGLGLGIRFDLP